MNKLFVAACLYLTACVLAGCGNVTETGRENDNPAGNRMRAAGTASTSNVSPPARTDPAVANTNTPPESPLEAVRNRKLDAIRKSGTDPSAPKLDVEAILKQSARPAPENSEFAVALTTFLVERRTFSKHPVLARVEKLTEGEKKSIRAWTTDGKEHKLPGDSIPALSTVPSATILGLLGIEPPPHRQSDAKLKAPAKN